MQARYRGNRERQKIAQLKWERLEEQKRASQGEHGKGGGGGGLKLLNLFRQKCAPPPF